MTNISDIKDYSTLYAVYSRLKTEGDKTNSASNAKNLFGQNIDIDGDKTAEIWEFMQKANEINKNKIFYISDNLRHFQIKKYTNISEDNPICIILSIESQIVGNEKTMKAFEVLNNIIGKAKEKLKNLGPKEKLQQLNKIIKNDFNIQTSEKDVKFLSQGISKKQRKLDCDSMCLIYLAVAHELSLPIDLLNFPEHAYVRYKLLNNENVHFETTAGKVKGIAFKKNDTHPYFSNNTDRINDLISFGYYVRAQWYLEYGKYQKSIEDYTTSIKLNPDYPFTYEERGLAYTKNLDLKNAINDFTTAIKYNPSDASLFCARGFAYFRLKKYENAIVDFSKAIKLDPMNNPNLYSYHLRGAAYLANQNYQKSIDDFTHAIKIRIFKLHVYKDRAKAYKALGLDDLAKRDLEMYKYLKKESSATNK